MYRPQRYLVRMVLFLIIVGGAVAVLLPRLKDAFLANTLLNGMILGVLLLGIVFIFRQVISLGPEISWLAQLKAETSDGDWIVRSARIDLGIIDTKRHRLIRFVPPRSGRHKANKARRLSPM